eukprot:3992788-Pleurochrysis_carterae.AAC.1
MDINGNLELEMCSAMLKHHGGAKVVQTQSVPFEDGATVWRRRLQQLRDFIRDHGGRRRPSKTSKNAEEKRLGKWVNHQQSNFVKSVGIMKDASIRKEWAAFVHAHAIVFEDGATAWR